MDGFFGFSPSSGFEPAGQTKSGRSGVAKKAPVYVFLSFFSSPPSLSHSLSLSSVTSPIPDFLHTADGSQLGLMYTAISYSIG